MQLVVRIYFFLFDWGSWLSQLLHVNYSVKFFVFTLKQKSKVFSISFYILSSSNVGVTLS